MCLPKDGTRGGSAGTHARDAYHMWASRTVQTIPPRTTPTDTYPRKITVIHLAYIVVWWVGAQKFCSRSLASLQSSWRCDRINSGQYESNLMVPSSAENCIKHSLITILISFLFRLLSRLFPKISHISGKARSCLRGRDRPDLVIFSLRI